MESQAMEFTAITETRIVADNGTKCMNFEAGQTRFVHKDLYSAAINAGLVPVGRVPDVEAEASPPPKKSGEEIVAEKVLEAVQTLVARGNPADFTQLGKPRTASVKKLVDCEFTAMDVERAFEQAMFEVEQRGDESTESPESNSSDSE
jgi:hypothetical protein